MRNSFEHLHIRKLLQPNPILDHPHSLCCILQGPTWGCRLLGKVSNGNLPPDASWSPVGLFKTPQTFLLAKSGVCASAARSSLCPTPDPAPQMHPSIPLHQPVSVYSQLQSVNSLLGFTHHKTAEGTLPAACIVCWQTSWCLDWPIVLSIQNFHIPLLFLKFSIVPPKPINHIFSFYISSFFLLQIWHKFDYITVFI